jgi:hypothetical protein
MQLTDELRSRIASEFRYAADHMRSEEDPHTKLYYYSALFGEVTRILNLNWDRDLVLAYTVLSATHSQVAGMAHNIGSGRERAIKNGIPIDTTDILGKISPGFLIDCLRPGNFDSPISGR